MYGVAFRSVWVVGWAESAHGIAASAKAQAIKCIRRTPIDTIADELYGLALQDLFGIVVICLFGLSETNAFAWPGALGRQAIWVRWLFLADA